VITGLFLGHGVSTVIVMTQCSRARRRTTGERRGNLLGRTRSFPYRATWNPTFTADPLPGGIAGYGLEAVAAGGEFAVIHAARVVKADRASVAPMGKAHRLRRRQGDRAPAPPAGLAKTKAPSGSPAEVRRVASLTARALLRAKPGRRYPVDRDAADCRRDM